MGPTYAPRRKPNTPRLPDLTKRAKRCETYPSVCVSRGLQVPNARDTVHNTTKEVLGSPPGHARERTHESALNTKREQSKHPATRPTPSLLPRTALRPHCPPAASPLSPRHRPPQFLSSPNQPTPSPLQYAPVHSSSYCLSR